VSETPRVDQVHWNHAYLKEEAYKLERELNAAQQRIKRLEEAGIELRECASQLGWTSSDDSRWIKRAESAVKAWDKEAKL
jgi:type IV secretory pathway VirD2 relaxase